CSRSGRSSSACRSCAMFSTASRRRRGPGTDVAKKPEAGMSDYLREAFLFRWNLLLFLGGTAAAVMTPLAPVLLPLVAAGELTYLTGLMSIPRFRAAIDAKVHSVGKETAGPAPPGQPPVSLVAMLSGLPAGAR